MWTIFKVYWICYNVASVVYVLIFVCGLVLLGCEACRILVPWWIKLEPPKLEGEALITRPPGKSSCCPNFRRMVLAVENPQYVLWFLKESDQFSSSLLVNLSRFERWSWTNTQDCQLMWRGSLVPEHHHLQRRDTLMNSVLGSSHSSPQLVLRMFLFWL